jgi:hypothetical protein
MYQKKRVIFKTMSGLPSSRAVEDGETILSQNIMLDFGEDRPIIPPLYRGKIPAGLDPACVHTTKDARTFFLFNDGNKIRYHKWNGEYFTDDLGDYPILGEFDEEVSNIVPIGNTLAISLQTKTVYALLKGDNTYTILGERPPEVDIRFGLTVQYKTTEPRTIDTPQYGDVLKSGDYTFSDTESWNWDKTKEEIETYFTENIYAALEKFCNENGPLMNRFAHPFFIRYAWRMYDNSNQNMMASPPVLLVPSTRPICYIFGQDWYDKKMSFSCVSAFGRLYFKINDIGSIKEELEKWRDVVTGIDFYVSDPVQTYHSDKKITGWDTYETFAKNYGAEYYVSIAKDFTLGKEEYGTEDDDIKDDEDFVKVEFKGGRTGDSKYDITELFPTKQRTPFKDDSYRDCWTKGYGEEGKDVPSRYFRLPYKTKSEMQDQLLGIMSFYRVQTIDMKELIGDKNGKGMKDFSEPVYPKKLTLSALLNRHRMTDDFDSHSSIVAKCMINYNSRLFAGNISFGLFSGYAPGICLPNEQSKAPDVEGMLYVKTYIKKNNKEYAVISRGNAVVAWIHYWYYPDVDAYKAELLYIGGRQCKMATLELQPSNTLNGAYWYNNMDSPAWTSVDRDSSMVEEMMSSNFDNDVMIHYPNQVMFTPVNNPFTWPAAFRDTVGGTMVNALGVNTAEVSTGQFGTFPILAFCNDGVWALDIGHDGAYKSIHLATGDVIADGGKNAPIRTHDTLMFISDSGQLMSIAGSQSMSLSDTLAQGYGYVFGINDIDRLDEVLAAMGTSMVYDFVPFTHYADGASIGYDQYNDRVYVYNPSFRYSYVYSLRSKAWAVSTNAFDKIISSYPRTYAFRGNVACEIGAVNSFHDGNLMTREQAMNTYVDTLIISRPIKIFADDTTFKRIRSTAADMSRNGIETQVALFGTRDFEKFCYVTSSQDRFIRSVIGSPYKAYIVAIHAKMRYSDALTAMDITAEEVQTRKFR